MFDYVKNGHSLNKQIEKISNIDNNKQKEGITGYLSNGLYNRKNVDKDAIISSFIPLIFLERRENLNNQIKMEKNSD